MTTETVRLGSSTQQRLSEREFDLALQAELVTRLRAREPAAKNVDPSILDGLDPLYALPALRRLTTGVAPPPTREPPQVAQLLSRLREEPHGDLEPSGELPAEHPLDFDWRFTSSTRAYLARETEAAHRLLLLGCPTLAVSDGSGRPTLLIDDNPALDLSGHADLQHQRRDLLTDPRCTEGWESELAIADPPFYPDELAAFTIAAAAGLRLGGRLLLVLPTKWARPGVAADLAEVQRMARKSGFRLERIRSDSVRYTTPLFEAQAYARIGLPGLARAWRLADIYEYRLAERVAQSDGPFQSDRSNWHEVQVERRRWRVRTGSADLDATGLLVPLGRLETVSRRDPARLASTVVVDDGRLFTSTQGNLLLSVLEAAAASGGPHRALANPTSPAWVLAAGQLSAIEDHLRQ